MIASLADGFIESHDPRDTLVLARHIASVHIKKGIDGPGFHILVTTTEGKTYRVTKTGCHGRETAQGWVCQLIEEIEAYVAHPQPRQGAESRTKALMYTQIRKAR